MPEAALQLVGCSVAQVTDAAGDRQTLTRPRGSGVVVAPAEGGIGLDGPHLQATEGDLVGTGRPSNGEDEGLAEPLGMAHTPFEDPHATHRASDHGGPAVDAEMIGQGHLGGNLVPDGHRRGTAAP